MFLIYNRVNKMICHTNTDDRHRSITLIVQCLRGDSTGCSITVDKSLKAEWCDWMDSPYMTVHEAEMCWLQWSCFKLYVTPSCFSYEHFILLNAFGLNWKTQVCISSDVFSLFQGEAHHHLSSFVCSVATTRPMEKDHVVHVKTKHFSYPWSWQGKQCHLLVEF